MLMRTFRFGGDMLCNHQAIRLQPLGVICGFKGYIETVFGKTFALSKKRDSNCTTFLRLIPDFDGAKM